jgi:putative membrane protein
MRKTFMFLVALVIVIGWISFPFAQDKPAKKAVPGSKFMMDAARDGLFHMEAGKLAVQRASSEGVKKFGQHSVEHHTQMNEELTKLAGTKGVTLPRQMSKEQRAALDKVTKLSGPDFDKAYLEMEISHHSRDLSGFQKEAKDGKDPDVKAWAAKVVAAIEEHLEMARGLSK